MSADAESTRSNQFERLYERLREGVLNGELEPGTPVSQVKLAKAYETSRSPLREALRMLQREGLIDAEPGKRARIAVVSAEDLEQIYAMRITLEALALRISSSSMDKPEFARMRERLERMDELRDAQDFEAWEGEHRAFHDSLVAAAGERLSTAIAGLADHSARYRRIYLRQPRVWSSVGAEHSEIVGALEARDVERAAGLLGAHFAKTALTVSALFEPDYQPTRVREALRLIKSEET